MACRDCATCCELGIVTFLLLPLRLLDELLLSWTIGLFVKKCPHCGHRLSRHRRQDVFN